MKTDENSDEVIDTSCPKFATEHFVGAKSALENTTSARVNWDLHGIGFQIKLIIPGKSIFIQIFNYWSLTGKYDSAIISE